MNDALHPFQKCRKPFLARICIHARVFDKFRKGFWWCYGVRSVLCQAMDVIRGEGDEGKDDGVGREADEADHHLSPASQNPLTLLSNHFSFSLKVSFWLATWRCQQGVRFTGLQGRETQSSPLSDLQNINLCSCWTPILVTLNNSPSSLVSSRLLKRHFSITSRLVWYVWPDDI